MTNDKVNILDPSGVMIRQHTWSASCSRKFSLMNEDSVTLRFSTREAMKFPVGSSVGDFYITQEQVGKWNASTGVWEYELKFDAYYWLWENKILRYIIPDVDSARETSFTLTATIDVHANVILNCLKYLGFKYDGSPFRVDTTDTSLSQEAKLVRYENLSILGGIQSIAEAFGCEWWVTGNAIYFGRCEKGDSKHVFEAGINTSSISFQQAKSEAPNRLYVYGSDRNLPSNYRQVDGNDTIGGVVAKRLMLPEGTPYLQTDPDIPENQIVEKVVVLDSVYPRTDLTVSNDPETYTSTNEDEEGNQTSETFYRLKYGNSFLFSESYVLPNEELHVVFQSGLLNGMDFGVKFNPKGLNEKNNDGSWNPDAQMFEVVVNEDYGRRLPDGILKPQKGDKFILYGWDSTKMADLGLIADAEQELLLEGQKALEEYTKDLSTCTCPMAWDYMKPLFASNTQPKPGDVVTIIDTAHFGKGGRKSRIIGFEYKIDKPYAECTYTCGENISQKRLDSIEKKIDGLSKSGTKVQMQNSLDFLSKRYSDRTPYKLSSDEGFEVGDYVAGASGAMIGKDAETGQTFGEMDRLFIRVKAYFETLTIINAETLAGKQYITPGGSVKITSVDEVRNAQGVLTGWKCYFLSEQDGEKTETKMIVGDQAISEMFNAKTGTSNKVSNHRYWRLVTAVSNDAYTDENGNHYGYIELSASNCETGSDVPEEGDVLCQLGWQGTGNADRQTAMVFSTVDADAPSIKMFAGINSYTLNDKAIISFGRDPLTNQVYFRLGNSTATQYLEYKQDNGLKVAGSITTTSTIDGKTVEDYIREIAPEFDDAILRGLIGDAQDAADNASDKADKAQADADDAAQAAKDAQDTADSAESVASSAFSKATAAEAEALSLKFLKDSLGEAIADSTHIAGGLILSTMMALGYTEGEVRHILAGMNGSYNAELGGRTPAAWYGGNMIDRFDPLGLPYQTPPPNAATSMIRMDGSAYLGGGAHVFNADGSGYLANGNIRWDAAGIPTIGSDVIIKISENETLNSALSNLTTHRIGVDNLFVVVENNDARTEHDLSWAAITENKSKIFGIKAKYGFFSDEFISARGLNANATSGSVGLDETQLAQYLTANGYVKQSWVEGKGYLTSSALSPYALNSNLTAHTGNTTVHITANERTLWNQTASDLSAILGADSDTIINKWEEVVAFLDTYTEADTLANLLGNKADKTTKISAGTGLTGGGTLASDRTLSLATSGITAGTYTKLTVDAYGRATSGDTLAASDIPSLSITKILGLQTELDNKLNASVYAEWMTKFCQYFTLEEIDGVKRIKANVGLYSVDYISARGLNGQSGGSVGLDETQLASYLTAHGYAKTTDIPSLANYVDKTTAQEISGLKIFTATNGVGGSGFNVGLRTSNSSHSSIEVVGGQYTMGLGCHSNGNWYWWRGTSTPTVSTNKTYVMSFNGSTWDFAAASLKANSFVKVNGTSAQFLKADGSVDSNTYLTSLPSRLAQYSTAALSDGNGFGRIAADSPFKTLVNTNNNDCMLVTTGYSDIWRGELALDYRSNNMAYRNKNNGTWNDWALVLTNKNISSYAITAHQSLANYVDKTSAQDISGTKRFTNYEKFEMAIMFKESSATKGLYLSPKADGGLNINSHTNYSFSAVVACIDQSGYIWNYSNNASSYWLSTAPRGKFVATNGGNTSGWSPVLGFKTVTGKYEIGSLNDTGYINYYHDTRTTNGVDFQLTLPKKTGTLAVTSDLSAYLPLTGGTLTGKLTCSANLGLSVISDNWNTVRYGNTLSWLYSGGTAAQNAPGEYYSGVSFMTNYVGFQLATYGGGTANLKFRKVNDTNVWASWYDIWHSGNDGSGSGLDADLLDGVHLTSLFRKLGLNPNLDALGDNSNANGIYYINTTTLTNGIPFGYGSVLSLSHDASSVQIGFQYNSAEPYYRQRWWSSNSGAWSEWKRIAFTSSNVASATKLQTARTIWGQSFDGTGNVSGNMTGVGSITASGNIVTSAGLSALSVKIELDDNNSTAGMGGEINRYNAALYLQHRGNQATRPTGNVLMVCNGGNVGIGTTAPAYKLDVEGDIRGKVIRARSSISFVKDSGNSHYMEVNSAGRLNFCQMTDGSYKATRASLTWDGVFYAATGIYSDGYVSARGQNTSDARLKTDIRDFNATDIIRALRPVSFRWNALAKSSYDVFRTDEIQYGLIAQETLATAPWLVASGMFGRSDPWLGIRYHKLIPVLAKAQQEVTFTVDDLLVRVKKLERENEELKCKLKKLERR